MRNLKKFIDIMKLKQQVGLNALQTKLSQINTVEQQLAALRNYRNELMTEQQNTPQAPQLMKITTDFVEELDRSILGQERQLDVLKDHLKHDKDGCYREQKKIDHLYDINKAQNSSKIRLEDEMMSDNFISKPKEL